MEPDNVLMGDATGTEIPEKPIDETALNELRNKAKYSKTREYKELRAKAQARIDFYKTTLPDGYAKADKEQRGQMWGLANIVIAEFNQLFSEHELADELLKEL